MPTAVIEITTTDGMNTFLHLAMVLPGVVCVACAATARPRVSLSALFGSVVMLAAMVSLILSLELSPLLSAALLLGAAMIGAASSRRRHGRNRPDEPSADAYRWLGFITMALMLVGSSSTAATAGELPQPGGHQHSSGSLDAVATMGAVTFIALVAVRLSGIRRRPMAAHHLLECLGMVVMTGAMLVGH